MTSFFKVFCIVDIFQQKFKSVNLASVKNQIFVLNVFRESGFQFFTFLLDTKSDVVPKDKAIFKNQYFCFEIDCLKKMAIIPNNILYSTKNFQIIQIATLKKVKL